MKQDARPNRDDKQRDIKKRHQYTDISKVKSKERRISAPSIDPACYKLRPVCLGNACPPVAFHILYGKDENHRSEAGDPKAPDPDIRIRVAIIKKNGKDFGNGDQAAADLKQDLYRSWKSRFSFSLLVGLYAVLLLPQ